jgi:hypothetical protein
MVDEPKIYIYRYLGGLGGETFRERRRGVCFEECYWEEGMF